MTDLTIYEDLVQGSDEWLAARRGIITASVVGKLITVGPPDAIMTACPTCGAPVGGPCMSVARKTPTPIKTIHDPRADAAATMPLVYRVADNDTSRAITATLAAERIAGFTEDTPMNSDMWRGVTGEPFARDTYSEHFAPVTETGFMVRDDWGFRIGYSPDGLVGDDGLIEIKSPRAKTHLLTVLTNEVPAHYMAQVQCGLLVSGRKWCDFISYTGGMHLWVKRVIPDPKWQRAIVEAAAAAEKAIEQMVTNYSQAVDGLPLTERIPDLEEMVI